MTQITATTAKTAIPPVAQLGANGREPFIVAQATADKRRDRIVGQALADLQDFRTEIAAAGSLTPRVDRFINEMTLLVSVTKDPASALDAMFATLAAEARS
jgi:hypothetical protein